MDKKWFLSILIICSLWVGLLAFPFPVFAQDETTPEPTSTPGPDETIATPSEESNPIAETIVPTEMEPDQSLDVFTIAQEVVHTAEVIQTGDPSGILGAPAYNAPAGTPFQYYKVGAGQQQGCTQTTPVLICYWDNPIQQAIDDAAVGSTITVDGGNYSEELDINKSITLLGIHSPVLIAPTTLNNDFNVSGQPNRPVIHVTGTSGVVIDGFTIHGAGAGDSNNRFIGIAYHNASGAIQNNSLDAFRDASLGGTAGGVGIYILNDDGVPRSVNVLDNTIVDYQKGGIVASGQNLTVDIAGNTITGQGPITVIDQNGIQISGNAGGIIDSNTISDNWCNSTSQTAAGVVVYNNSAPLTISNNIFDGNQINIRIQDSYNVNITGNTILNASRGIEIVSVVLFGEANATITGNTISGNEWGVFTDNTHTIVTNNSFIGNVAGLVFNNQNQWNFNEMLSAPNNYWGCPTGPYSGDPNCDSVEGLIMYQPFQPAPGQSLDQYMRGIPAPRGPGLEPEVVPVSSGQVVNLSCDRSNVLQLPDGSEVGFNSILCGYSASVDSGLMTMTINVSQNGSPVNILPNGATARISLAIPAGLNAPYAILFWDATLNAGAGDWVVLPGDRGYLSAGDERMVTSGVTDVNGMLTVEVNFTGTFVIVGQ
jgi:hypothetical protein